MLSSILLSTVLAQSAYVSAQGIGPIGRPWGARAASAAAAVTWDNLGCFSDPSKARVLKGGYATTTTSASTTFCQNLCLGKGYSYTGTESGKECWCSNTFTGTTKSTACTAPCAGDSSQTCGGTYAVNVYSLSSSSRTNTVSTTTTSKASTTTTKASTSTSKTSTTSKASSTTTKASSTTTKASTTTSKASTTSSKTGTSTSSSATSTSTNTPPSSGKVVIAHHIVGNSYQYTQATWASNIAMAQAAGIDGFALNIGSLDWQRARVADAYAAAKNVGFKLFLSFDMSAMPCASAADALAIRQYMTDYATHPAQLFYKGKQVASTFSGSDCQFGQGSLNAGWQYAVKTGVPNPVAFIPSFFSDPSSFSQNTVQDGDFNWNGGWPMSSSDITFSSDQNHINSVPGKFYIAPVTPLFFTHYGPNTYNKNWIYRSDDNLYNTRWEELIQNRAQIDIVEIITWNDYGESHYIGPMGAETDQPMSQAWVDGFDHTAWATMTKYYADAWRTGAYPAITKNKIYISSRPAPKTATPSQSDSVGIPNNWQWTDDNIYAVVFSTGTYTLRLSIGSSSGSFPITAGVNKIKLPMAVGSPQATLVDSGGNTVLSFSPTFSVVANPPSYNFNYYIQASP